MAHYKTVVNDYEIKNEIYYHDTPLLKYSIQYPQFSLTNNQLFVGKLNQYYRNKAFSQARYCDNEFYKQAVKHFIETEEDKYPFYEFEFQVTYKVSHNHNCVLSLYFDEWRFMGGANGTSRRSSESWDLFRAVAIKLSDLYPYNNNYLALIKEEVKRQISERIKKENGNYFDQYPELTETHFNQNQFYLTPDALTVYFQEVTIAPHASGTITFDLPYIKGPIKPEPCV